MPALQDRKAREADQVDPSPQQKRDKRRRLDSLVQRERSMPACSRREAPARLTASGASVCGDVPAGCQRHPGLGPAPRHAMLPCASFCAWFKLRARRHGQAPWALHHSHQSLHAGPHRGQKPPAPWQAASAVCQRPSRINVQLARTGSATQACRQGFRPADRLRCRSGQSIPPAGGLAG